MSTFAITTAVNIDTLSGKTGGDTYNINGGYLTIDQDSRIGLNQTTSASIGAMTLSATLGGICEINSTLVRIIPYNTGTGNVPAFNTTISRGGASGLLIGVYSALNVASTATGAAMPASGFIKIKQWNSVAYSAGSLTGIGASATDVDREGWLEIVGDEAATCTVNRLNTYKVRGGYFDLGTTDGVRATTYQIPSSGMLQYHAGVEVETGTGTGIYEFYPCAGTLTATAAVSATDSFRGKQCWISSAGLLRFGHDGTNSTGGYIPPTGRKVRIANIFFANCTTAARTANVLPNATLATRYEFATTGGGVIDMDKCSTSWYLNLNQPYSVTLSNVGICTGFVVTEVAQAITWSNVNVGQEAANTQIALTMNLCFAGGTITDMNLFRTAQAASGAYVCSMSDNNGFTFNNCFFESGTKAANATTGSINLVRGVNCTFNNCKLGGGRAFHTTCTNVTWNNTGYYDNPGNINTLAAIPMYMFDIGTNSSNIKIDGVNFGGLFLTQPYNGILQVAAAGCSNIKLRNIGSYASPLSLGKPRVDDAAWTRVTTTATVTETAHPFLVNDTIYVVVSSDTSAITVAAKTITAVTANTFSFVCLNAGSASGTVCYFGTKCANVFVLATSAAANNVKIQRVYAPHTRTNLYTTDNSSKNITLENVFSDYLNVPLIAMLNGYSKGVSGTPTYAAQTAVYGTHWVNGYVCDVANSTTNQSYTRTTTTVTVTSVGHSLRTGMLVFVDPTTAPTTFTSAQYSVTVTSSSTFNITVANAGAASGTLDYRVANGRIGLVMNEASPDTVDRYTIDNGTPAFTSAGGLVVPVVNDQITFVTPNYLIGQGATFPIFGPVMAGGTITNYDLTYAIDKNDGNGYSSFKNLSYRRAGAGGSNGSTTITMTDTTGVNVDDYVFGTNTSPLSKVVSIDSGTNITVNSANIGTVSGILRFNQLPNETGIDPALGIKMKWRIKNAVASTSAITSLYIQTESTDIGRANQYPLDTFILTLTGLQTGSDIVVLAAGTETERINVDANAGTTYNYEYETPENIDIGIFKMGYVPFFIRNYLLESSDASLPIVQVPDRNYII